MDIEAIEALEQQYKNLVNEFQAGKIDDATFISEVDKLQFQDDYGRYWMIGTQTGFWHYYDGQAWHQANPREADKLPFIDEQGRYWQRGVKSGDWYYHHPETGEWVKPSPGDGPVFSGYGQAQQPGFGPYQSRLQPQSAEAGPGMPSQLDGELYQDDEGRYWAVGAKTGQWYFYDHNGWHPAHEFQPTVAPQPPQFQPYTYQPQPSPAYYNAQPYQAPPAQSAYQPGYGPQPPYPPQESQRYAAPPQPQQPAPPPQPAQTEATSPAASQAEPAAKAATSKPDASQMPPPPTGDSETGSWYYFDGKQWLKYSTGEPEETPPPAPKMVIEQEAKPSPAKVEAKSEPVVAEIFEEDEPEIEVVDVEVITVVEPEPEEESRPVAPQPEPAPQQPKEAPGSISEEVIPRRSTRPVKTARTPSEPVQPQRQPRERTSTEPGRPIVPRKKETAHEPTIIIPTGATASKISSPASTPPRETKPVGPISGRQRRARENTLPLEPVAGQGTAAAAARRREVTQPMPPVAGAAASSGTAQMRATPAARQAPPPKESAVPASAGQAAAGQPQKAGYTFGDVLRSLPSTIWTFVGGVVLLLACAIGLIFISRGWLPGEELGSGGLAVAVQSPTPTLAAGPPDATPTPGPTPSAQAEANVSPTPVAVKTFSSAALGIALEYPEAWEQKEEDLRVIFAPSTAGLDPDNLKDAAIWIGIPEDESSSIADLLTSVLSAFPADAETLNEGTISIASQTWTSAQIRYNDEDLGGQGIATLAVTNKDGVGYYLVAVAPADEWNATQPLFQGMINSFRFSTEEIIAQASAERDEEGNQAATPATTRQATPASSPTPKATATPLTYVVQAGDTLGGIAARFGVDVDLLASENNIESPESLQIGQELIIPFTAEQLAEYNASGAVSPAASSNDDSDGAAEASAAEPATAPGPAAPSAQPAPAPQPEPQDNAPAPLSGRIAYAAFNPGTNNFDLWLADVATGEQGVIAGEASQPAFNRDGSLLAYRSWALDSRGIFFRDFVGGRGGQVTRFVEDGLPTWAPDGYSFAFASRREGDRVPRIYIGNQLGEDSYSIGFQGEYPATFPDGRLVVKGCLPSGDCGLYIMGATGGGERKIGGPEDTAPAVSPDGNKIAFMSSGRGATNWEIWVMNSDGSSPQRLTENGSNEGLPAWSPDGKSIAYVSDQGGSWAIWVMNADGSNQRKLFNMKGTPDGYVLHDKDNSKGWLEERISWAP